MQRTSGHMRSSSSDDIRRGVTLSEASLLLLLCLPVVCFDFASSKASLQITVCDLSIPCMLQELHQRDHLRAVGCTDEVW